MVEKKIASRDALLGFCKRRYKDITIAGLDLRIQSLSEREKSQFEVETLTSKGDMVMDKLKLAKVRLMVLCLVEDDNTPMFAESDYNRLQDMDGAVVSKIYDDCRKHCGFEDGDIEGLVKNFDATPSDASP